MSGRPIKRTLRGGAVEFRPEAGVVASANERRSSRLLKNSVKWDRQIDPVVLRCSQH